jgi:hypothetical protein
MVAARHQARLMSIDVEGRWPRPVSLPVRMLSSTRACGRWRALEELRGLAGCVGGHELVAPSVCLFEERQLGAGVGLFTAGDDPQVGRPVRQLITTGSGPEQR